MSTDGPPWRGGTQAQRTEIRATTASQPPEARARSPLAPAPPPSLTAQAPAPHSRSRGTSALTATSFGRLSNTTAALRFRATDTLAGRLIAAAIELLEPTPPILTPGFFFLVVFFEFAYYTYVLAFAEPIFGAVPWPAVLLGNLVAVASMIAYFWRRHSDLPGRLLCG